MTEFIFDASLTPLLDGLTGLFRGTGHLTDFMRMASTENGGFAVAPLINDHIIELNDYLMNWGKAHCNHLTSIARILGAIFAIIMAAGMAYKMMAKGEGLDILKLGKPLLVALVLSEWNGFVELVSYPGAQLEVHFREVYLSTTDSIQSLRQQRNTMAYNLADQIGRQKASGENMTADPSFFDKFMDVLSNPGEAIQKVWTQVVATSTTWITNTLENIIHFLGEIVLQVAVYLVFLVKALMFTVAVMFGPIYVSFSLLPPWEGAWHQWIERTVQITLYGAMAYLVMTFVMQLIAFATEGDIAKLTGIVEGNSSLAAYTGSAFGTVLQTCITYFVGAGAMFMSFEMASFAIPGSMVHGSQQFFKGMSAKTRLPGIS